MSKNQLKKILGSYSYRYNIGTDSFKPEHSMDISQFLKRAKDLGFEGVQLCENFKYATFDDAQLEDIYTEAQRLGLFIEVGMSNLTEENLLSHIRIADRFRSNFIRVVLGETQVPPKETEIKKNTIEIIRKYLPVIREKNITLGIENHFDLNTTDLKQIVEEINDPHIGLIFDTTNALGFIEEPTFTLNLFKNHLVSIHIKDYIVKKVEAGYFITGALLGDGLLDGKLVLSRAINANPSLSIVMEFTMRRENDMSKSEVLLWETRLIEENTRRLHELIENLDPSDRLSTQEI